MSKYDFEIDLSLNSSTGMILNKIRPGSVVLEFGCAAGRMTRYMKENLGCQVYIVEYDEEAYQHARPYAEDGLCDDILAFRWVDRFKKVRFDAILFADVLEHLTAPERVLEEAAKLLKDTGCVYASIPNITHNDILLKAYAEHFDYTATGLLDDTHVHFWGLKNIKELSGKCGLHIREMEGTYCPTGDSEQCVKLENTLLENILRERCCGEVYQFIVTMDKISTETAVTFRTPTIKSHIYLDHGEGFHANDLISVESEFIGQGSYRAHYVLEQTDHIRAIRFDPVEGQGCVLRNIAICQGEENLPLHFHHSFQLEKGFLLPEDDPMVYADVLSGGVPIVIDAEILLPGKAYMDTLQEFCVYQRAVIDHFAADKQELQQSIDALCNVQKSLRKTIEDIRSEKDNLQKKVERLSSENEELQRDISAYNILISVKEKYAIELEQTISTMSSPWKYCKYLGRKMQKSIVCVFRAVKRRIKRN